MHSDIGVTLAELESNKHCDVTQKAAILMTTITFLLHMLMLSPQEALWLLWFTALFLLW